MLIIRASGDSEFRTAVEAFLLHAEDLKLVEGQEYVYHLPVPSMAQMPQEMTAVVKLFNAKYGKALQKEHHLVYLSGPIALWLSKGRRHTPTSNKVLVGIATSKPQKSPLLPLSTRNPTQQGDEATDPCENASVVPEHDTLSKGPLAVPGPQGAQIRVKKLASEKMSPLFETLEEEAEIVVETPSAGNEPLDWDTADLLLLDGDEFIAAKMGGIGLIGNVYQKVDKGRVRRGETQEGRKEAMPSVPV